MVKGKKWMYLVAGGVGALALAAAVLFVAARPVIAVARSVTGWGCPGCGGNDGYQEALADALGVTVEELQAAYQTAHEAAIRQAVEEGVLTQEQADQILDGDFTGPRGGLGMHSGFGMHGGFGMTNDLLADALGISVEELETAQETAFRAVIAQAVEDGTITQEEADLMAARMAVNGYVGAAMADAYTNAVGQAVADGVITQAQADQLLNEAQPGFRGFGGPFGGRGGMGGWMHGGSGPFDPGMGWGCNGPHASSDGGE